MCSNYPGIKLEPALGTLETKLNICHHMLTSSTQLQNKSFHVAERTRTSTKCQKMKNARAKRAKILFFIVNYANLCGFCCRRPRGCLSSLLSMFVRPEMGYVRAKIGLTGQFDRSQPGNYLQPCTEVQKAISFCRSLKNTRKFKISIERINPSSETRGRLAGARGNKLGKQMKRRKFTSKAEKAFSCKPATLGL